MDEKIEPVEPLFKYLRLACDLHKIVKNSSISCISCNTKVIFVGDSWFVLSISLLNNKFHILTLNFFRGDLHILDHEGNVNSHQKFPKHIVGINQISVDSKGENIATCSDDGQARIEFLCFTLLFAYLLFSGSYQLFVRRRQHSSVEPRAAD